MTVRSTKATRGQIHRAKRSSDWADAVLTSRSSDLSPPVGATCIVSLVRLTVNAIEVVASNTKFEFNVSHVVKSIKFLIRY